MKLNEITIRDPFILSDKKSNRYYLYGTTSQFDGLGFYCYTSNDLHEWDGPYKVFSPHEDFWGKHSFWAPEVNEINGEYYLTATFKSDCHHRSCQILKANSPLGPFEVYSDILTPNDWESLDGTLYFEDDKAYLIFVHEWTQIVDGEICIVELSNDLKKTIGKPITLFKASSASWAQHPNWSKEEIYVADGPFVLNKDGKHPFLMWSSYLKNQYDIGYSIPLEDIKNPKYYHSDKPLPVKDAGHGMVFNDFNGNSYLVLHEDNSVADSEHPVLIPVKINEKSLEII